MVSTGLEYIEKALHEPIVFNYTFFFIWFAPISDNPLGIQSKFKFMGVGEGPGMPSYEN